MTNFEYISLFNKRLFDLEIRDIIKLNSDTIMLKVYLNDALVGYVTSKANPDLNSIIRSFLEWGDEPYTYLTKEESNFLITLLGYNLGYNKKLNYANLVVTREMDGSYYRLRILDKEGTTLYSINLDFTNMDFEKLKLGYYYTFKELGISNQEMTEGEKNGKR